MKFHIFTIVILIFVSCANNEKEVDEKTKTSNKVIRKNLAEGEKLFDSYCTPCHSKELDKDKVGPKLGNIAQYRDMDWLINFTKYPLEMIQYGDSISLCNWENWQPSIKGSFINRYYGFDYNSARAETKDINDSEINQQIKKIYDWIAYESLNQNLDSITLNKDICRNPTKKKKNNAWDVHSIISRSGIHGLSQFSEEKKRKRIEITLDDKISTDSDFDFSLIYPDRNLAIPFIKCEGKYILLGSQGLKKIHLPKDEVVYLYGNYLGYSNKKYLLKKITTNKIKIFKADFSLSYDELIKISLKK